LKDICKKTFQKCNVILNKGRMMLSNNNYLYKLNMLITFQFFFL